MKGTLLTVDQTFPSYRGTGLLEVYSHEDVKIFTSFISVLLEELSVFESGFNILCVRSIWNISCCSNWEMSRSSYSREQSKARQSEPGQ